MSWFEISQLVIALSAFGSLISSIRNARKIEAVHIEVNSRITELLKTNKESSHAEGYLMGIKENGVKNGNGTSS